MFHTTEIVQRQRRIARSSWSGWTRIRRSCTSYRIRQTLLDDLLASCKKKICKKMFVHLTTKMNITSLMGNEVLNIFSFNNFFEKSNIFGENGGKKFWRDMTIFQKGSSYTKNEYNLFYRKLVDKYFYVKQFFFRRKRYFLRKLQKFVLEAHLTIFQGKGLLRQKINITFFITNQVMDVLL